MSYLSYPPFPHNNGLARRAMVTTSPANGVETDTRSSQPGPRAPGNAFPFMADARNFSARMPDLASALYGLPYSNTTASVGNGISSLYPGLPPGIDLATLQTTLSRMDPKEIPAAWRCAPPHLYPYDPALASLVYQGGYAPLALETARRKNATRETTSTLKTWLNEHRKNPYPTKGEKIMLAIVSKMTLTQVSTWFANARRRLKKENRMTWLPRNRCGDGRDSDDDAVDRGISSPTAKVDEVEMVTPPRQDENISSASAQHSSDSVNGPYQHYQQQMLLRHIASLPPHLRTPEALRHFQEQMQLSYFASGRLTKNGRTSSSEDSELRPFVHLPSKESPTSITDDTHRRNSVGSPSTSSHDRSPSPLHRPLTFISSNAASQHPFKDKSAISPKSSHSPTRVNGTLEGERIFRSQSLDVSSSAKSKIWSPANMALDKAQEKSVSGFQKDPQFSIQSKGTNDEQKVFVFPKMEKAYPSTQKVEESSMDIEDATSPTGKDMSSNSEDSSTSPKSGIDSQNSTAASAALDWMLEYKRQYSESIHPQQAFAARLASFASNCKELQKQPRFFGQFQRQVAPLFASPSFVFPDHSQISNDRESRKASSSSFRSREDESPVPTVISDAPINLSKNSRRQSDVTPYSPESSVEQKPRLPSISAK
ncbi:unnamed protein product [Clavelina lepadiformis]|uniref:Homeobox domain-containing protein n=1 Tax=Clavelina lepadiformis TaxID=159417 RepID=A0ABP0GVK8_CLALP